MHRRLLLSLAAVLVVVAGLTAILLTTGGAQTSDDTASRPTPSPASASAPPVQASPAASPTPPIAGVPTADELLLRLTDVPAGYMIGDDSGCGQIAQEGSDAPLLRYIEDEYPAFCQRQLEYVCQERPADHPLVITSAVVFLSSEQKASEGMELVPSFVRWLVFGPDSSPRPEAINVGDEAQLYDVEGLNQTSGLLIAWRNATTLNFIEVIEPPPAEAVLMMESLALLQNGRYASPLAPEDSDTYDAEVTLDCDDSEVPVYWLERDFSEDGLPEAELRWVTGPIPPGRGPGMEYMLEYETTGAPGFGIFIWTAEQWDIFVRSEAGRFATSRPCATPEVIDLGDRTIEIHSPTEGCSQRYMAHVLFPDAIVTINVPFGALLGPPLPEVSGSFDTPEALEQISRALEKR